MSDENQTEEGQESAAETSDASKENFAPDELGEGVKGSAAGGADVNLNLVLDVPVNLSLRVGSTDISIRDLVSLVEGSVIALDKEASEPMDVLINGMLIARGEIVVADEKFGVRLTDVVSTTERIESLN